MTLFYTLLEKPRLSSWAYWSYCSKSCGGGIQYRKRKCIPSSCPYSDPKYNKCYGSEYEERKCNEKCCPGWTIVTSTVEHNNYLLKNLLKIVPSDTRFLFQLLIQRDHTGVNGKTGLPVVGVVEVDYLIEGGTAINPNVHIPIIKPAMEMIMNIKGVMSNVVQVRNR